MLMPHRVFDPSQQRVIHASITEKKRLAEVLSYIIVQQQTNPPKIRPLGKQPIPTCGQGEWGMWRRHPEAHRRAKYRGNGRQGGST